MKIETLAEQFQSHQHSGSDGSQPLAKLDFKIIARNTLSVASTSLIMSSIPQRTFLRVYISHDIKNGNSNNYLRFNNDSSGNYTFIEEINNTARTSQNQIDLCDGANSSAGYLYVLDIINDPTLQKVINCVAVRRITSAGSSQVRHRVVGSWVNTTKAINRIDLVSSNTQTFGASSTQILVYGSNF